MVVHCSAGVGRTGTFISVDHALDQILDLGRKKKGISGRCSKDDVVDCYAIVEQLRKARNHMVQTEAQYQCIYSAVLDAVTWLHAQVDLSDDEESSARKQLSGAYHQAGAGKKGIYYVAGVDTGSTSVLGENGPAAPLELKPGEKSAECLYDHEGKTEHGFTSLSFFKGDSIVVINSRGDGWTHARLRCGTEGWAPTSYIKEVFSPTDKYLPRLSAGAFAAPARPRRMTTNV